MVHGVVSELFRSLFSDLFSDFGTTNNVLNSYASGRSKGTRQTQVSETFEKVLRFFVFNFWVSPDSVSFHVFCADAFKIIGILKLSNVEGVTCQLWLKVSISRDVERSS